MGSCSCTSCPGFFFYLRSFPHTARAGLIFTWGVSLTHPVLASSLCGEFLLHILSWLNFYAGSFSYTSRAGFFFLFSFFIWGYYYTSCAGFIFLWEDSLTHPMLALFFCDKKTTKKKLKTQSKCHVFVNQVCFSYGESPRTPPLEGTSLHRRNISVERPWWILSLMFTTCLPLWVKSSHQSRCHVSPTQELITYILRRQSSPIYGVLEEKN